MSREHRFNVTRRNTRLYITHGTSLHAFVATIASFCKETVQNVSAVIGKGHQTRRHGFINIATPAQHITQTITGTQIVYTVTKSQPMIHLQCRTSSASMNNVLGIG